YYLCELALLCWSKTAVLYLFQLRTAAALRPPSQQHPNSMPGIFLHMAIRSIRNPTSMILPIYGNQRSPAQASVIATYSTLQSAIHQKSLDGLIAAVWQ